MATFLKEVRCGNKRYYVNHTGSDVYCSPSSKTSGTKRLKGLTFKNNVIQKGTKTANDYDICEAINK